MHAYAYPHSYIHTYMYIKHTCKCTYIHVHQLVAYFCLRDHTVFCELILSHLMAGSSKGPLGQVVAVEPASPGPFVAGGSASPGPSSPASASILSPQQFHPLCKRIACPRKSGDQKVDDNNVSNYQMSCFVIGTLFQQPDHAGGLYNHLVQRMGSSLEQFGVAPEDLFVNLNTLKNLCDKDKVV